MLVKSKRAILNFIMRLKELDLVRGFATCWVVGIHFWFVNLIPAFWGYDDFFQYIEAFGQAYSLQKFFPLPFNSFGSLAFNTLNSFFVLGYQGVHLFFVLSGFGLTYSQLVKPEKRWLEFLKKKFRRIYPTYWMLLIICLIIPWTRSQLFFGYFSMQGLWRSFLILDKAIPYSWFMFPLIQFYLCFFVLFKILQGTSIRKFLGGALAIKLVYTLIVLILGYTVFPWLIGEGAAPGYLAFSRLFEFCLGMVFAKIYLDSPKTLLTYLSRPQTMLMAVASELLGILGSFTFANEIVIGGITFPLGIAAYDAFIGFGIFVIVFNLARWVLHYSEAVSNFLKVISDLSYEIYLIHFIALELASTLFAFIVHHESPWITMLRAALLYALILQMCVLIALALKTATRFLVDPAVMPRLKLHSKH